LKLNKDSRPAKQTKPAEKKADGRRDECSSPKAAIGDDQGKVGGEEAAKGVRF
jgi:hypothetical protein